VAAAELARGALPCRVRRSCGSRRLAQELIVRHETFDAMLDAYSAASSGRGRRLRRPQEHHRVPDGLAVQATSRDDAAARVRPVKEHARRDGRVRLATSRSTTTCSCARSRSPSARRCPWQIHTGFGDSDLDLRGRANPLALP
jgi:hypothetical protein